MEKRMKNYLAFISERVRSELTEQEKQALKENLLAQITWLYNRQEMTDSNGELRAAMREILNK